MAEGRGDGTGAYPWRIGNGALRLAVRLTPRGGRDAVDGIEMRDDGRAVLKARVRAAPEDGEANAALIRLLASALGVSSSQVSVAAGHTSRVKSLVVTAPATELDALALRLEDLVRK